MTGRKFFPVLTLAALIFLVSAFIAQPALAETEIIESQVSYEFGLSITFQATLKADAPPEKALLVFEEANQAYTSIGEMQVTALGDDAYELVFTHLIEKYRLRAFTTINYHIEVRLEDNQLYTSPSRRFEYIDNRFEWQSRSEGSFQVFWFEGDTLFAQSVLDVAQEGLERLQGLLNIPQPAPIRLYIYPDTRSMQAALRPGTEGWVAGHADPDLGVAAITLPPGPEQRLTMEQRVPHEITHIILYQVARLGYKNLPMWLNEGLASLAELYPNSDYPIILEEARQRNGLIDISSLCESFPRDVSSALLSYAQSASFVQYLHDAYGVSGLQKLVDTYANGYDCERGVRVALGAGLTQIERQWRREALADDVVASTLNNLLPWLILLALALAAPLAMLLLRRKIPTGK